MQGVDPTGGSSDSRVMNKVCTVIFSSLQAPSPPMVQTGQVTTTMTMIGSFGLGNLVDSLLVENGVHRPRNLLSLEPVYHSNFDNFNLWFEHTEKVRRLLTFLVTPTQLHSAQPNRYQVCFADSHYGHYLRHLDHLQSDNHDRLFLTFFQASDDQELPDPQVLVLHGVCARVAHMSGVAEAFDKVERDVEDTRVLAFNGWSAHLLDHLLTPIAAIPGVA